MIIFPRGEYPVVFLITLYALYPFKFLLHKFDLDR